VRQRLTLTAILVTGLLAVAPLAIGQTVPLTILHTNDTHGHLQPFSYPDSAASGPQWNELVPRLPRDVQGMTTTKDIGGIARRATLIKRIREEQARKKVTVWLADIGDYSDGSPFSTVYHGEADVAAMNAAGYDMGTLGNHEFNNSMAQLQKLIGATKYQLLNANATVRATGKPLLQPYVIKTVGVVRVGVFGLITHEAGTYQAGKEAIDVADEVESARRMVAELKGKADIIVVLSHAGEDVDKRLAKLVPEVDVIVGGHSHTRIPSGELIPRSDDLLASSVNGTVIVQAHQWGDELGRLDLLFAKDAQGVWRVARYSERLIPVTADLPDDPGVAAVVDGFWKPIAQQYSEVIGDAAGEFSSRGDDMAEYNLMADALRETYKVDVAFENIGGVRAPLLRGRITRGDLVAMDPFGNTVVLFKLTGKELRQVLGRSTPVVSGIRYRVQNREVVEATVAGEPLDDGRTYSGVTNSYFAGRYLTGLAVQDTGKPRLEVLIAYVRQKSTVYPAYDGRRVVVRER
jgi:5'-nucleotidase / UDP-sugar diphosphatase